MDQQTPTSNLTSAATTAISSVSSSTPPIATVTPTHTPTPTPTTTAEVSQPTEPSPAQPPPAPQSQPSQPPSFTTTPTTSTLPPPAPNPTPRPIHPVASTTANIPSSAAAARPQLIHRPWQHPHPHSHFSQLSSSISPPIPSPQPRGSVVMGVPASHPTPSPPSFSSSFSQQFTGLSRGPVNVADSVSNASNAQMRMIGPMSSSTSMRPAVISIHHQPRPGVQASLRPSPSPQPPSPNNQTPTTQNFQGHGFMRSPSTPAGPSVSPVTTTPQRPLSVGPIGSPAPSISQRPALGGPPAPNASQSMQSPNQPWLSTGSQGKPPLPSPSFRPSMNPPSMQQRSHIPSQHHSVTTTSQQQHMASTQRQPLPSNQPPDHFGQQFPPSRGPQSLPHQQPLSRGQVTAHQKSPPLAAVQPNTVQPVLQNRIASTERDESGNRILCKRSIHELVSQIDSSERLDPEVEDILADIADEFVESITTFGCSLAKHRKSDTLEAKDILLHLERNWNITLPGFGADEIKTYRKPLTNDIHKERLAAVKKSIVASEVASAKNTVGQASANAKSNMTKTPANTMVSPNLKVT